MRNMSFFYTQHQIRNRTKTVTRRDGWEHLKQGDRFRAIVKGQGLKKGEKVEVLAELECVSNTKSKVTPDDQADCSLEGFPELSPAEFKSMFKKNIGGNPNRTVNRIEFKYV